MDEAGHDLLAHSRFPQHQDRRVGVRHLAGDLLDAQQAWVRGHELSLGLVQPPPQEADLLLELLLLEHVLERQLQLLLLEGLGEVVGGPPADRVHHGLDLRHRGLHDDRQGRLGALDVVEDLEPAHPGHQEVQEDYGRRIGASQMGDGLLPGFRAVDLVAQGREEHREVSARVVIIVHDEDACSHLTAPPAPEVPAARLGSLGRNLGASRRRSGMARMGRRDGTLGRLAAAPSFIRSVGSPNPAPRAAGDGRRRGPARAGWRRPPCRRCCSGGA